MYRWLPIIFGCHCMEERSFHWRGEIFPICARCTGELLGILAGLVCSFFFRTSTMTAVFLMLPMIIDGTVQMFTSYNSHNFRRLMTGILFGFGLAMLFVISTITAFQFGVSLTR